MPGALAATAAAAPAAPAPASAPTAATGKAGGDSFLEALGLNQPQPAAKPEVKTQPAASSESKDAADPAEGSKPAEPVAASANPALAWLLNLIGGGEPPPATGQGGAATETLQGSAAGDKAPARNAAPAGAPLQAGATPVAPVAAAADPVALATGAAATSAALPPANAPLAHEKAASAAAPAAADAPTPAATAPAAPIVPQLPVATPQHSFASLLAQAPDAATAPAGAPHAALPQDSTGWPAALHEHVRWQLDEGVQEARLELHPRELGSVQVQLRIAPHGAEVQFAAAHPQARQALEASLPQLRALLAADGLYLAQANVGSQSRSPQQPAAASRPRFSLSDDSAGAEAAPASRPRIARIGLVDAFA